MRLHVWLCALVVSFGAALFTGCGSLSGGGAGMHGTNAPCPVDEIRVGEELTFSFPNHPEKWPDQRVRVKDDGTIDLPLIGSVSAASKKLGAVEKEIKDAYEAKWFQRVTVIIKPESRFFTVGGEVKRGDRFPYLGTITVLQAIQAAGDFTDFANRRKVEVIRFNGERIVVDCKKALRNPKLNVPICPGDFINVPRSL